VPKIVEQEQKDSDAYCEILLCEDCEYECDCSELDDILKELESDK